MIDITVVDYPEQSQRFKIVYLFLSHEFNQRIILYYHVNENEVVNSLTSIFPAANAVQLDALGNVAAPQVLPSILLVAAVLPVFAAKNASLDIFVFSKSSL